VVVFELYFFFEKKQKPCVSMHLIERRVCNKKGLEVPKPHSYNATPYTLGATERSATSPAASTKAHCLASAWIVSEQVGSVDLPVVEDDTDA
jgi:hypothetical protein